MLEHLLGTQATVRLVIVYDNRLAGLPELANQATESRARNIEQMRLINALCRLTEMSGSRVGKI